MGESNISHAAVEVVGPTKRGRDQQRSRNKQLCLLFGTCSASVVLAVGQDMLYRWLNQKSIETLPQQWVTNIGTAFAFAVKLFVALTATNAFVQHQWRGLKGQAFEIREIDTMADLTTDPLAVFSRSLWLKTPMLIVLASVVWLAPIAAVFSPGAIHITSLLVQDLVPVHVPQLRFANNSAFAISNAEDTQYQYSDASPLVHSVALSTATSGLIASIAHPFTNISYSLTFDGPAIKCFNASKDLQTIAAGNVYGNTGSGGGPFFISFVYGDDGGYFDQFWNNSSGPSFETLGMINVSDSYGATTGLYVIASAHLFQCELYNASYDVAFDFYGGTQEVNITAELLNPVGTFGYAPPSSKCVLNPLNTSFYSYVYGHNCMTATTIVSYQAVMQAFNSLYVGGLYGRVGGYGDGIPTYVRQLTLIEMLSSAPDWNDLSVDVMQRQMESQFRNITVSLLGQPIFTQKLPSDEITATVTTFPQLYDYQPFRLWMPYSVAIAAALFCVVIGSRALVLNEASYTNHFSTFARITSQLHRDGVFMAEDDASNPCPKPIGTSKVTIPVSKPAMNSHDL